MTLLDDLKRQAQDIQAKQDGDATDTVQRRELTRKAIRPKLRTLYKYFHELTEQLAIVLPDVRVYYDVDGFGRLADLQQCEYRISTENPQTLSKFTFQLACRGEGELSLTVDGRDASQAQKEYLWGHGLHFASKLKADGSGVFRLAPVVPVVFEFAADEERAAVRMRMRNLNHLGVTTHHMNPSTITPEFIEELGKSVLRQPSRFDELAGNAISDETRRRLRQQVAEIERAQKRLEKEMSRPAEPRRKRLLRGLFRAR